MFSAGGLARALYVALFPGAWALLYQIPVVFAAAYWISIIYGESLSHRKRLEFSVVCALAGTFAHQLCGLVLWLLGIFAGPAALWFMVAALVDRHLDPDTLTGQEITKTMLIPILLIWIIVGITVAFYTGRLLS